MNPIERDKLLDLKNKKRIKNKEIAEHLGCSESLVSKFFNNAANMDNQKLIKMYLYIRNKKVYKYVQVLIEE